MATAREDLVPRIVRVEDVRQETPDIRSIRLSLVAGEGAKAGECAPGVVP